MIIAYSALHHGRDYYAQAIRSVIDHVDTYYVLYARLGSHGSRVNVPCPDSRDELLTIARRAAGDKLVWVDGNWSQEGEQRDAIHEICPEADVVLVLDSDEIWHSGIVNDVVKGIPKAVGGKRVRIPMIHFWRSFYRAVLHDPAYPIRVIYPKVEEETETTYHLIDTNRQKPCVISHMGYACRAALTAYKQLVHGHRSEWRKDIDWFQERFLVNAQQDCHPVGSEYWNVEAVDPLDYMPEWMNKHPYFNMDIIP